MAKYRKNATRLAAKLDKIILDHFLNPLGNRTNKAIQDGLDSSTDINGDPFAENAPSTIDKKGSDKPLFDSGDLKGSVRKKPANRGNMMFEIKVTGKPAEYGAKHNMEGGFTSEEGHHVPQREWFGLPKSMKEGGSEYKKFLNEARLRILTTFRK